MVESEIRLAQIPPLRGWSIAGLNILVSTTRRANSNFVPPVRGWTLAGSQCSGAKARSMGRRIRGPEGPLFHNSARLGGLRASPFDSAQGRLFGREEGVSLVPYPGSLHESGLKA